LDQPHCANWIFFEIFLGFFLLSFLTGNFQSSYKAKRLLGLGRGDGALALLADEGLVDVRDDTTTRNSGLDQGVQLLVSTDGQLEMPGSDPLHFQILGGIAGQLEHLSGEVLQDGGAVDGGGGADPAVAGGPALEVPVDPTNRELKAGPGRP